MPSSGTRQDSNLLTVNHLFFLAVLVSLPSLLWHNWPSPDAAVYYLPMIREFRAGNWSGAWFPMIPPLFTVVTGLVVTVIPLPILFTAKLISILFFAGSVFPLHRILQPIYGRRTALIGCLLMIFCSRLIRDGAAPLLDSGKMFFLLWCVCLTIESFRRPLTLKTAVAMAGATAALALIRGEGLALAIVFIVALFIAESSRLFTSADHSGVAVRPPWRTAVTTALFLILISPWALYLYSQTGYPVLDSRQIAWVQKTSLDEMLSFSLPDQATESGAVNNLIRRQSDAADHEEAEPGTEKNAVSPSIRQALIPEIVKGTYRYYLPLYILGIIIRVRRKEWNRHDWIIGGIFFGHTAIMIAAVGGLWTQARYLLPVAPLLFGWAAIGGEAAITRLARKLPPAGRRKIILTILAVLAAIMVFNGNSNAYHYLRRTRPGGAYTPVKAAAAWLREHGTDRIEPSRPPLQSTENHYHSGRRPVLMAINRQLPYFAGGDAVFVDFYSDRLDTAGIIELARLKTVDFIIVDQDWRQILTADPDRLKALPDVKTAARFGDSAAGTVYILQVLPP